MPSSPPRWGFPLWAATLAPPLVFACASFVAQGGYEHPSEWRTLGSLTLVAWVLSALGVLLIARPLLAREYARRGGLRPALVFGVALLGGALILAAFGSLLASSLRGAFGTQKEFGLDKLAWIAAAGAVSGLAAATAFWLCGGRHSRLR